MANKMKIRIMNRNNNLLNKSKNNKTFKYKIPDINYCKLRRFNKN